MSRTTPRIKAAASGGNGGSCVEARRHGDVIEVRDTKAQGEGPILSFTPDEWAAFLDGAKKDEFDHLL